VKDTRRIKSYVIRGGRLSEGRKRALAELYDAYGLPFSSQPIQLASIYPPGLSVAQVVVEIGFGTGEVTAALAIENPATFYIAIEVFPSGVGNLLKLIHEHGIKNIKVIRHDAVEVVYCMIPDSSIDGFHVFFPDPWPKKKHQKRRLLNKNFVELIRNKLKIGGYLYAVTDWENYAEQIVAICNQTPDFRNTFENIGNAGFSPPQKWRPETKFEMKGLAKRHLIREIHCTKGHLY
jgi:tRNA (guanine-N7-)-methyltransferase